ncbi:MAG: polyisoprenyl-phosphate glycosyltransferase [Solirubrobacteraceae bacterium]|nr:polyisoprenyl-phosphate glycosyltransferase [Solirubrobacteraceae bacterium]
MLRERLLAVVAKDAALRKFTVQFVVSDDTGGRDPAIAALGEFHDVTVVQPAFNLGHQRAIVYALRHAARHIANTDVIVTMDSDGQDRPEDLTRMLAPMLAGEDSQTVVLARRTRREESVPFKLCYLAFRIGFRALTGKVIRSGNYAAYRGVVGRRLLWHPYFDLCYSSSLIALDLPVHYVPCERGQRYGGESRMNIQKLVMHGLSMLIPFTDRIAIRTLFACFALAVTSIALALTVLAVRLLTPSAIPGWATYTFLGLAVLTVVLFGNIIVLFVVFSQSRGTALAGIEYLGDPAGSASNEAD